MGSALAGLLAALAAVAGCNSDAKLACRLALAAPLARTPLTLAREAFLHRAGDAFVLISVDGDLVRWAKLNPDGTLGAESALTLPPGRMLGHWFGLLGRAAPADQLVAAFILPKAGASNQLSLQAIVQDAGGMPAAAKTLLDLPVGVDPAIVRIAMGTSRTGRRALLALGYENQPGAPPSVLVLGGGGDPVVPPIKLDRTAPKWTCLSVVASRTEAAVSVIETEAPIGKTSWHIAEFSETENRMTLDLMFGIDTPNIGCPVVAPTPRGYVIAYQNKDGTYFSHYDAENKVVSSDLVAGVVRFGGAANQPPVACVAPMGSEYGLAFESASGHEVWRFDAFGDPQGRALFLPSRLGRVGPLSALPGFDMFHATYLDQAGGSAAGDGNSPESQRYFVRVDCPAARTAPDGGGTDRVQQ